MKRGMRGSPVSCKSWFCGALISFCVFCSTSVSAFLQPFNHDRIITRTRGSFTESVRTVCRVAASDAMAAFSKKQVSTRRRTIRSGAPVKSRNRRKPIRRDKDRWDRAEKVEEHMLKSLETMETVMKNHLEGDSRRVLPPTFPSVRDCNAALATFGDGGDFLRALRLFVKMRKAASLASGRFHLHDWNVPAPTLVTYSTLMSRAVGVGRPQVALRLWNLMKFQGEFWSNPRESSSGSGTILIPDVRAANILMNAHAKLGNAEQAFDIMRQMQYGNGTDVPATTPNIVTYNTLLDACHKAGDLDAALQAKQQLDAQSHIEPDARTYTSLIATVARKPSTASGANDPSLAFEFLKEMKARSIHPNGMTYSALIDACGRCRRPDLALQGLRIMLRQKSNGQVLPNEVGAWTAAIDACCKSGRLQTARRLFWSMSSKFGVQPNTITCGCYTDGLLKNGKTAETLQVLRYMKREGIVPSEVMYTSLMTSAEKLVQIENQKPLEETPSDDDSAKAIEVYTELILSLMQGNTRKNAKSKYKTTDSNSLLVKVFLVFQEMKEVGATPDLACYNALLRACARAGDVNMAKDVLERIRNDGLHPNDTSWRELIRAAAKNGQSEAAESMWNVALAYRGNDDEPATWQPSTISFGALASAYLRDAFSTRNIDKKKELYSKVITMYKDVVVGKQDRRLHLIGQDALEENPRSMLLVLQALVDLAELTPSKPQILRDLATTIVQLDCFANKKDRPDNVVRESRAAARAFAIAQSWLKHESTDNVKR